MLKASLIISVYEKIRELELILNALSIQSFRNFEVLVADDGSGDDMRQFIKSFKANGTLDIAHIYQKDSGFRKNRILNKAIKHSKAGYIIFIDGDCIPHSDFINEHYLNKKKNSVLCGRRVNLSKRLSEKITADEILTKKFEKIRLKHILDSWKDKKISTNYVEEGLVLKNKILRKFLSKSEPHILGCNFSLHRELIEKINGFDENYIGPGLGEDSDVEFRLRLAGAEFKSVRNLAVLFHLFHGKTVAAEDNLKYFREMQKRNEYVCKNGIVKL